MSLIARVTSHIPDKGQVMIPIMVILMLIGGRYVRQGLNLPMPPSLKMACPTCLPKAGLKRNSRP